jgi:hypothetical protein
MTMAKVALRPDSTAKPCILESNPVCALERTVSYSETPAPPTRLITDSGSGVSVPRP